MMSPVEQFWPSCLARFAEELSAQQFNTWIKPLSCAVENESVALFAPNQFSLQFVKDRFLSRIEKYAAEYFGAPMVIELRIGQTQMARPATNSVARPSSEPARAVPTKPAVIKAMSPANETTRLNPNFTFETLVTGKANQLARAAAIQIAENPGSAYNPLFVYGGVGLGKTHLIQAIGNYMHQHNPDAKIRYIHAERYVADVVRAYQHKAFDEFKRYYHSLDLLLIDDIQFFSGKNRTQEEFFYAFNALIEGHRQVIITSDRYPKEIEGI